MKTKDNVLLGAGERHTLYYIDIEGDVKTLMAIVGQNGDTSYGPSGIPLMVEKCFYHKHLALNEAIKLLGNTINALDHRRKNMIWELTVLEERLGASP